MVDKSVLNKEVAQPYSYTVERGKIREFAEAIGDPNPIYVDSEEARARGYKDVTVPPTFATCMDFWSGPDFFEMCKTMGFDPVKVLHGEQEYEYYGEINPGDVITARSKVTDIKEKQSKSGTMAIVTTETTYTNQQGETVLVARGRTIERG